MAASSVIKIGPWGGRGDFNFDVGEDVSRITMIILYTGDVVNGLEIFYVNDQNETHTYLIGSLVGESHEVDLDSDEYINWMVLSYKQYFDEVCISELGFKTNLGKEHGPFGQGGGQKVTIPVVVGRLVGFFGQSGDHINSIGVCLAP